MASPSTPSCSGWPPIECDGGIAGGPWSSKSTGAPWGEGRAFAVVVANGQFLRDADLVPRGHPGDGRIEVQVYDARAGRARGRCASVSRVAATFPHPRIAEAPGGGSRCAGSAIPPARPPWEIDGHPRGPDRRGRSRGRRAGAPIVVVTRQKVGTPCPPCPPGGGWSSVRSRSLFPYPPQVADAVRGRALHRR